MLLVTFMKCLFLINILILIVVKCEASHNDDDFKRNVYNGDEVLKRDKFKSQVSLQYIEMDPHCTKLSSAHLCGGSLINTNTVLAAAHCFITKEVPNYVVAGDLHRYGETDGRQERLIERYCIHEDFKNNNYGESFHYDFAAIRTYKPFIFNEYVDSLQIALHKVIPGTDCRIVGWGQTGTDASMDLGSNVLRYSHTKVLTKNDCFKKIRTMYDDEIMLCVGKTYANACKGDGPLICGHLIAGVPSFGSNKCDSNGYFVFARARIANKWYDNFATTGSCSGTLKFFNRTGAGPNPLAAKSNRIHLEYLVIFIIPIVLFST